MSEPVKLYKGAEQLTVYGPNQKQELINQGWSTTDPATPVEPSSTPTQNISAETIEQENARLRQQLFTMTAALEMATADLAKANSALAQRPIPTGITIEPSAPEPTEKTTKKK